MKFKKEKRDPTPDGCVIRKIRESLGLTQKQFAERIGTTQSTVSNWESFRVRKVHSYWRKAIQLELGITIEGWTDGK